MSITRRELDILVHRLRHWADNLKEGMLGKVAGNYIGYLQSASVELISLSIENKRLKKALRNCYYQTQDSSENGEDSQLGSGWFEQRLAQVMNICIDAFGGREKIKEVKDE